jgi:GntR family transcriptional repressor for pyruvate dehydrogenase complex
MRLYETVIDALSAFVAAGHIGPDGRFPTERELEVELQVSRPVLREAFRVLEMHGHVETRQGGGRTLVGASLPDSASLRRSRLEATRENLVALWDAREHVERRTAALAASAASAAQLAAIAETIDAMGRLDPDSYRATDLSLEFHVAVGAASGNPYLAKVVRDLVLASRDAGFKDLVEPRRWDELQADHRPILDAIAARDPDEAARAMSAHFDALRRALHDA